MVKELRTRWRLCLILDYVRVINFLFLLLFSFSLEMCFNTDRLLPFPCGALKYISQTLRGCCRVFVSLYAFYSLFGNEWHHLAADIVIEREKRLHLLNRKCTAQTATHTRTHTHIQKKQDARLAQRNRAAGCVIVFARSRRLELGDNILRTL